MRNWIRISALALALLSFALINLDASTEVSGEARFVESLFVFPVALLAGALWGALIGASTLVAADLWNWLSGAAKKKQ